MSKVGISETAEVLVALNELSLVIIKHARDGLNVADVPAIIIELMANDAYKSALGRAIDGISAVPAEVKDLQLEEGFELAKTQFSYLPKLLEAMKKA